MEIQTYCFRIDKSFHLAITSASGHRLKYWSKSKNQGVALDILENLKYFSVVLSHRIKP